QVPSVLRYIAEDAVVLEWARLEDASIFLKLLRSVINWPSVSAKEEPQRGNIRIP
ncbi:hypothetical protein LOAG_19072, partial [Loa loa]